MNIYTLRAMGMLFFAGICSCINAMENPKEQKLCRAACKGYVAQARKLLKYGVYVDACSVLEYTPLMIAADEGKVSMVKFLLAHKANPTAHDSMGVTALDLAQDKIGVVSPALAQDKMRIVKLLKARIQASVVAPSTEDSLTPEHLFSLACSGNVHELGRVVTKHPKSMAWRDEFGMNALMCSANKGRNDAVAFLLDQHRHSLKIMPLGAPLHAAARGKQLSTMRLLLDKGIAVDSRDSDNATALMHAARSHFFEGAQLLLAHHADVNACTSKGETALMCAVNSEDVDLVKLLLASGADIAIKNSAGNTALSCATAKNKELLEDQDSRNVGLINAAYDGELDQVKKALERGAYINARDAGNGRTALMFALAKKRLDVANVLLKISGFDKHACDNDNTTALMFTALYGRYAQMKTLLEMGADVDAQDNDKCTALIFAAEKGYAHCVRLLLAWGACAEHEDCYGLTAQELAELQGHAAVVEIFKKHTQR